MNGSGRHLLMKIVGIKNQTGFTLIELLVTIIILGVLAAISLPQYLNQAVKSRSSEAKATLGQISRAQQAYRFEKGTFADSISALDTNPSPRYFDYAISSGSSSTFAMATATPRATDSVGGDLPAFASAVSQASAQTFAMIICKTPTKSTTPPAITTTASCPTPSLEVP